jgi:hypothetical protein
MEWWQQIHAYSKRDQLSFDFVRWKLGRENVRTLNLSYNDNRLFQCDGTHKSQQRIVSEHLESAVRCQDLPQSFLAAPYDPRFDRWPQQFVIHLRRLNDRQRDERAARGQSLLLPSAAGFQVFTA